MAGIVTIRVERTSNIVTGRNFLKRILRSTSCFILFQYNNQEERVDDTLTLCATNHHEWNKEVCFQIDPTSGDCVWVTMYRDNNKVIGKCHIILSQVPNENHKPFSWTFILTKGMPSASNEGDVQGHIQLCMTFNRPAQEAPYPPPPPSYPPQWPHSQPPQQPMYPPGPRQPWQNDQQQTYGPPQDQWQKGPPAPQPMPNLHPGPLYPPNYFQMSHDQGNHQAQHPGARPNFSDIPIEYLYPPPISSTSSRRHHRHHTATDPSVWPAVEQPTYQASLASASTAEQRAYQAPLASASTAEQRTYSPLASASTGTDDEKDSEWRNFLEAFAPSSNR